MTAEPATESLDGVLEFVKKTRGFDFTGYKRSSIERRVTKRMAELGVDGFDAYLDHLELHGEEFAELFDTLLINVTSFYRDPPTWEYLAERVVPDLLAARAEDAPIRVWCAGCASGEEAYTLAMVLADALGDAAFLERVKIYATDVDEGALDEARQGAYLPRIADQLPAEALDRYFERTAQRYVFRKSLRRAVIFGRNDLVQDAPISRIDLLSCRNTLMYFNAETQGRILRRLHFALADDGVLVLGKSEMLVSHADLFTPLDVKRRVFSKVVRSGLRDRIRGLAQDMSQAEAVGSADTLRESAFDLAPAAQVVVDREGVVVMANEGARRLFGLGPHDLGRPLRDLELSYRPLELRGHLERVFAETRGVVVDGVHWRSLADGQERIVDVRVAPLTVDGELAGASLTYVDVTEAHRLRTDLEESKRELELAYEELQSTVEELETTNEELQSTNEELETTNEELQSTNEELETMNEELQSTNEELETMNDELRQRTFELNDVNAFLEAILTTLGISVAVLDVRGHVQVWNGQSQELWGLRPEEAEGQHFLGLDIGLPLDQLKALIKACLDGESLREEIVVEATSRRGKAFRCAVTCVPLRAATARAPDVTGVIVLMEPRPV